MLYIVEGVDHTGKNLFLKLMSEVVRDAGLNIPIFNGFNVYDKNEFADVHQFVKHKKEWQKAIGWEIVNLVQQTNINIFVNRFHWSEIVYGKTFRGTYDEKFYKKFIERELRQCAHIIYLESPINDILARIKNSGRNKPELNKDTLKALITRYESLVTSTKIPVTTIENSNKKPITKTMLIGYALRIFRHH